MDELENKLVTITNDKKFEGTVGRVIRVLYVNVDGVKTPFKAYVKITGYDNVVKSGFTKEYIERKNLPEEGIVILKDTCYLEVIK